MIGIIDYGMSNLKSVLNAFNYLNYDAIIIDKPIQLKQVDKVVLPGVGAFGLAMEKIKNSGFEEAIKESVMAKKIPFMGICLGMQLMLDSSTEKGNHKGLGLLKGKVDFLGNKVSNLPVPHVGWNTILPQNNATAFGGIDKVDSSFYFVHSYYCDLVDKKIVSATVDYGGFHFDVAIETDHIFAYQFHPEKSQKNGLTLLEKFAKL